MNAVNEIKKDSTYICDISDLVANSGVTALLGNTQIAIFYLPEASPSIYAIGNWDPIGKAEVLSRGLVGDINGVPVVASPLYKEHFDLTNGQCLEKEDISVPCFSVYLDGERVLIAT